MTAYLLWTFLGLYSAAQAAQPVSIEADPRYQGLPFCAYDCLWNDNNIDDIASSISFIFPCSNSCYCNPDTIEDALSFLGQCIISSECCDMTDYVNAVSLYYNYCNANEPWSMPIPSEIGTAVPSPTSRTTVHSTASWCSTAHFSPTSTTSSTSTTSRTTRVTSTRASTATTLASSSGGNSAPSANLVGIIVPCISVGVTFVILGFCAWIFWRVRRTASRNRTAIFAGQQPDSTPLIIVQHSPVPRPSSAWNSRDHIEAVELTGNESHLGTAFSKDATAPPPYSP